MELPDFIKNFPALDLPFPEDMVKTRVLKSDAGLMVFFEVLKDVTLPPHSHKGQWGTVLHGEISLTIDGKTTIYHPGQSYEIPSGVVHGVTVAAGSIVMDIFEEPDRYPIRN